MRKIDSIVKDCIYLFFCIVVVYGCSSPEDKAYKSSLEYDSSTSMSQGDTSSKVEEAGPHSFTVEIRKMKFYPEEITVHKGDTVIWINNDMVTHCITEEKTKAWTSSEIQAGSSWKKAITKGSDYYCAIHQVMKGKILVQ